LLDANISRKLVEILKPHYTEIWHVENITLPQPAKDSAIWDFAKANDATQLSTFNNSWHKSGA
jgi:predicted nuclease of predicted toxin-antitoxin system